MFRQSGNSAAGASASGELLVTGGGSGPGSDVNLEEVGGVAISLGQKTMAASLPVVIASNQSAVPILSGFSVVAYDFVSLAVAALTDTYTFKTGGSGGSTVATITITYTDSTKVTISTVAKT